MSSTSARKKSGPVDAKIAGFLAKYSPALNAELRAARSNLRKLFPRGHELVYDNYNALVFAFSATERASDAFLSVAGYPNWVTLFFLPGVGLDDPNGLLQGSGSQVRSIRLSSAGQLREPAVKKLIAQAMAPHRKALKTCVPLVTTIKSVSAKQRPRRSATGSRKARE